MKIGFDFRMGGSINAGIGRYSFELLTELIKISPNDQFFVIYNQKNSDINDIASLKELGAELIPTNINHYSLAEQLYLYRLLNKLDLDLVHFPNFNVPILYKGKFVVTIHDMVHHKISGHKKSTKWKFYAYKYIIEQAAKRAVKIITVTNSAKKDIVELLNISPDKVEVIYEAPTEYQNLSPNIEKTKAKYLITRPYFLFVGTLERKKNVPMLTKGFDILINKYKVNMDLVVAGKVDKHYPDVKDKAMDIRNKNNLIFTDYVTNTDQMALYQGAYAFVTASMHEGFGLPGVEAMKAGIPLLASNIPVFNEVYDNAAIYFDPTDPDDIAEKMYLLISDTQFHQKMQRQSFERAQYFSWKKCAEETLQIYHSVVQNNSINQTFLPENEI